jgi:hypothetical protein
MVGVGHPQAMNFESVAKRLGLLSGPVGRQISRNRIALTFS